MMAGVHLAVGCRVLYTMLGHLAMTGFSGYLRCVFQALFSPQCWLHNDKAGCIGAETAGCL